MNKKDAIKRINELSKELEKHNHSYYVLDNPSISDYEYDMMMQELKALEAEYPELILPTSPTQRVGGTALNTFDKVEHVVQMASLQDVFSKEELVEFDNRIKVSLNEDYEYVVELKTFK